MAVRVYFDSKPKSRPERLLRQAHKRSALSTPRHAARFYLLPSPNHERRALQSLTSFQERLAESLDTFRKKYPDFEEAYSSYTSQYGDDAVRVHEPFKISNTIDPVIIVLGRTTPLFYRDSRRALTGSLGSIEIEKGNVYVLGRRASLDSKLVVWSQTAEQE